MISFGVADGRALYMVYSLSPAVLIHVPLGDAWQYRGIEHFSARGLRQEVERQRAWNKVWEGKKEEKAEVAANEAVGD